MQEAGPSGYLAMNFHEFVDDGSEASSSAELLSMKPLLDYPEEVALRLTDTEYELFYRVPPIAYLRQVTMDLGGEGIMGTMGREGVLDSVVDKLGYKVAGRCKVIHEQKGTVRSLIKRFNEVSAWATELVLSYAGEDRKSAMICMIRIAQTCWNIGNFNGAMEIVAGLKSKKLKACWPTITDESMPGLEFLSAALLSAEYERALGRALAMPECRVIPFFGSFLRELREILSAGPALTSHSKTSTSTHRMDIKRESIKDDRTSSRKDRRRESARRGDQSTAVSPLRDSFKRDSRLHEATKQVYTASFDEQSEQSPGWKHVGPDGLVNLEKVYRTQAVMDHIATFHTHFIALSRCQTAVFGDYLKKKITSCEEPVFVERPQKRRPLDFEDEAVLEMEEAEYFPVQPISHDHGVDMFPLGLQDGVRTDRHILQIMHHGTACVVGDGDPDWGGAFAQLRLERGSGILGWCITPHLKLPQPGEIISESTPMPEFCVLYNPEDVLPLKYTTTLTHETELGIVAEEGFIELQYVKDIRICGQLVDPREVQDMSNKARKFGIKVSQKTPNIITLVYGRTLSDNRTVHFVLPTATFRLWAVGLYTTIKTIMSQAKQADRSLIWLKNKYIDLYYDEGWCGEPLVSEVIKVFGGKANLFDGPKASTSGKGHSSDSHSESSKSGNKFKKNKSASELKGSPRSHSAHASGTRSEDEHPSPRHRNFPDFLLGMDKSIPSREKCQHELKTTSSSRQRKLETSERFWENLKSMHTVPIGYEKQMDYMDFICLFRSFSVAMRPDIKKIFDQLAEPRSLSPLVPSDMSRSSPELHKDRPQLTTGLLTKNGSLDLEELNEKASRKKAFDLLAMAAVPGACVAPETNKRILSLDKLRKFCEESQEEYKSDGELKEIIQRHEPDPILRKQNYMSFEGFVRFLTAKENYAFVPEEKRFHFLSEKLDCDDNITSEEMSGPLSQYYIASSHNTYLTGHQLKGESSVELYSQVLLTGCRCVELDCWDGDDGSPVIYHGHTFTTKISFRRVCETIARSAFITTPLPLVLSIENHCSVSQQQVIASTFQEVFGESLVQHFMFEADYSDHPQLPSPGKLLYKILVKNKKLPPASDCSPSVLPGTSHGGPSNVIRPNSMRPTASTNLTEQRTNSVMSAQSAPAGSSVTDYFSDEDYDEDEDELDDKEFQRILHWDDIRWRASQGSTYASWRKEGHEGRKRKRSDQIAQELSDMVIYVQAIKFHGLKIMSPKISVKKPSASHKEAVPGGSFESSEGSEGASTHTQHKSRVLNMPASQHPCYTCSSINEVACKKICKKKPRDMIAHTETQLVRTYPAALRIDSSNLEPLLYWSCGVQMVALNYQTEDQAMAINAAMFESNGLMGYVRKPDVMWDPNHIAYRQFNPLSSEFDGIYSCHLHINIISGQYVAENMFLFYNAAVEVEIIGVPVDCAKYKTKVAEKNTVNPIWEESFDFTIKFPHLAFLRFEVYDADTNYKLAQRVVPLCCLRPGYRHVRLRTPTNQPLNQASLWIYSSVKEELAMDVSALEPDEERRYKFIVIYAVSRTEPYSIVKVSKNTTTTEVIAQCISKTDLHKEAPDNFVLVEEIPGKTPTQRVLTPNEKVLSIVSKTPPSKLFLKRASDDPSSRAWLTSIRSASTDRSREQNKDSTEEAQPMDCLVCVYNVSREIPYAMFKVPLDATPPLVISQALSKARCECDPDKFVLVEEIYSIGRIGSETRVLADDEQVYLTQVNHQASWNTKAQLKLQVKGFVEPLPRHRAAIARIQRGLSMTRGAISASTGLPLGGFTEHSETRSPIQTAHTDPPQRRRVSTTPLGKGIGRAKGHSDKDMRSYMQNRASTSREAFRRLSNSLANHRASLSSELGSIWDFIRIDKDRRRSEPSTYEPIDPKTPTRLAKDLLQVVQDTVFSKKFDEKRCPLVKEESDLSSEEGTDKRIANLIDFFFTIVKSQKDDRKNSTSSCFKTAESPVEPTPRKVNIELEKKMETLMEFLATTGCMEDEDTDNKKITLMEFLFGPEKKHSDFDSEMTLTESNVNVTLSYIDETPVEEKNNLVDILIKYMENYEEPKLSITPCLSEKSKSDITISKLETFSDISKTKSDSTLTHTQETVIEREISDKSQSSRRISETVIDFSNVKQDLDSIFEEALSKVYELREVEYLDTMSEQEDAENFNAYTKPLPLYSIQCLPYSVDLSDIPEEDEFIEQSRSDDRYYLVKEAAEELIDYIEDKVQKHFDYDSESEFDIDLKRSSISLIDLRSIPDLPPSMIIKPKVLKLHKSTSTTEISDSISDLSRRIDSCCMTEDTTLTASSERQERALDKLESLHKFFSRSRLEIIDESLEEHEKKAPKNTYFEILKIDSKIGQSSLDDVEDLQDDEIRTDEKNDPVKTDTKIIKNPARAVKSDGDTRFRNDLQNEKTDLDRLVKSDPDIAVSNIISSYSSINDKNKMTGNLEEFKITSHEIDANANATCSFKRDVSDVSIVNSARTVKDDIGDLEVSEIDKIITDAIKIIIANELENKLFKKQNSEDE